MATPLRVTLGVLATLLVWITAPALAQPSRSAAAGLQVEAFDVEQVPRLSSGTQLKFSLYGTPGAAAMVQIDGARRGLELREVEPGIYEGSYTIDAQDQIGPDSPVTAMLRRGDQVARSVLEEPLQLGAPAPMAARPPVAEGAPIDERAPIGASPRIGTPVPRAPVPAAPACADCAVVESIRAVELGGVPGQVGAVAGGVAGAIFGDDIGRAHARHVAWVLGTLGGVFTGREVERGGRTRYDVVLRLPSGAALTRSYDSAPPFQLGDTVRLAAAPARAQRSAAPF